MEGSDGPKTKSDEGGKSFSRETEPFGAIDIESDGPPYSEKEREHSMDDDLKDLELLPPDQWPQGWQGTMPALDLPPLFHPLYPLSPPRPPVSPISPPLSHTSPPFDRASSHPPPPLVHSTGSFSQKKPPRRRLFLQLGDGKKDALTVDAINSFISASASDGSDGVDRSMQLPRVKYETSLFPKSPSLTGALSPEELSPTGLSPTGLSPTGLSLAVLRPPPLPVGARPPLSPNDTRARFPKLSPVPKKPTTVAEKRVMSWLMGGSWHLPDLDEDSDKDTLAERRTLSDASSESLGESWGSVSDEVSNNEDELDEKDWPVLPARKIGKWRRKLAEQRKTAPKKEKMKEKERDPKATWDHEWEKRILVLSSAEAEDKIARLQTNIRILDEQINTQYETLERIGEELRVVMAASPELRRMLLSMQPPRDGDVNDFGKKKKKRQRRKRRGNNGEIIDVGNDEDDDDNNNNGKGQMRNSLAPTWTRIGLTLALESLLKVARYDRDWHRRRLQLGLSPLARESAVKDIKKTAPVSQLPKVPVQYSQLAEKYKERLLRRRARGKSQLLLSRLNDANPINYEAQQLAMIQGGEGKEEDKEAEIKEEGLKTKEKHKGDILEQERPLPKGLDLGNELWAIVQEVSKNGHLDLLQRIINKKITMEDQRLRFRIRQAKKLLGSAQAVPVVAEINRYRAVLKEVQDKRGRSISKPVRIGQALIRGTSAGVKDEKEAEVTGGIEDGTKVEDIKDESSCTGPAETAEMAETREAACQTDSDNHKENSCQTAAEEFKQDEADRHVAGKAEASGETDVKAGGDVKAEGVEADEGEAKGAKPEYQEAQTAQTDRLSQEEETAAIGLQANSKTEANSQEWHKSHRPKPLDSYSLETVVPKTKDLIESRLSTVQQRPPLGSGLFWGLVDVLLTVALMAARQPGNAETVLCWLASMFEERMLCLRQSLAPEWSAFDWHWKIWQIRQSHQNGQSRQNRRNQDPLSQPLLPSHRPVLLHALDSLQIASPPRQESAELLVTALFIAAAIAMFCAVEERKIWLNHNAEWPGMYHHYLLHSMRETGSCQTYTLGLDGLLDVDFLASPYYWCLCIPTFFDPRFVTVPIAWAWAYSVDWAHDVARLAIMRLSRGFYFI